MSDDPLKLGTLPLQEPPADLWNAIEAQLDERAGQHDANPVAHVKTGSVPNRSGWLPMAMAAAVSVVAIGLVFVISVQPDLHPVDQPRIADAADVQPPSLTAEIIRPDRGLAVAQRASALLEQRLKQVSNRVVDAEHLDDLIMLESELGWVDELLAARPSDTRLWQQRVALLDQMSQRYASNDVQSQMINVSY